MKLLTLLLIMATFTSCTSKNEHGNCIGAFQDKDPTLKYNVDIANIAIGIIFMELLLPPIYVIRDQTFCPTGKK